MKATSKRVVALISCLFALTIGLAPATAKPAGQPGLDVVGMLPHTVQTQADGFIVGIDDSRRRMYFADQTGPNFFLQEYDLTSQTPRMVRREAMGVFEELGISSFSPYTIQIDRERGRMVVLTYSEAKFGSRLIFVDLKSMRISGEWDLAPLLPGFIVQGITISEQDDRIYLLGSQAGTVHGTISSGARKPAQLTVVAALEADLAATDQPVMAWARPLPQCQQVMDTESVGALIARSDRLSALYFACIRADQYPGESGLVRLWIDKDADQAAAFEFPFDFYPVSGSFTHQVEGIVGTAAFDARRERFFVQSQSTGTPGVWVFDGKVSSWVGFIVSPDNTNWYFGLDTSSGHYYMTGASGADPGYVVVSDVSQTPVTQGVVVSGFEPSGFIAVDERTHRLFMPVDLKVMGLYKGDETTVHAFLVVRDNTSIVRPQKPVDYDEITSDVKEGRGVVTSFSGGVNGYGSRVTLVGGYGGVVSAAGRGPIGVGSFRPGDRGLTAARVRSVDLRSGGASAAAQALVPDNNTAGDLYDSGQGEIEWPWGPASCLDGGASPETNEGAGPSGSAVTTCDLDKNKAEASSSWGAVSTDGLSIGASAFDARTWRDPDKGVITETVTTARGIDVSVPGGGSLTIAKVWASARTVAHGRSGSAEADYARKIIGIELIDADGQVVQRIGECGAKKDTTCHEAIAQLNKLLPMKVRIDLHRPVVAGTPRGAFAAVQLRDGDFIEARTMNNHGSTFAGEASSRAVPALQITVYNDSDEKSRLVTQLAAIEANSIYTNTVITEQDIPKIDVPVPDAPIDASGIASGPGLSGSGTLGSLGAAGTGAVTQPIAAAPVAAPIVEGTLAFLRRSPGSAVLVAMVWTTFLAAGAAVLRRRSLLALLLEGNGSR